MDKTTEHLITQAKSAGFSAAAPLDCATIQLREEVRDMCNANKCQMYGKNWACPPGCGTLDECRDHISGFEKGVLVQTTVKLEDAMDYEAMMEGNEDHKKSFQKMNEMLHGQFKKLLPLGAGTCLQCSDCTYPDQPCRFPDKASSSMEAYGMLVSQVCQDNDLPYYYGENTVTYTSCFLYQN